MSGRQRGPERGARSEERGAKRTRGHNSVFEISTTYRGRSINATVSIWAMTSDTCDASIACTLTESINRLSHRRCPYERGNERTSESESESDSEIHRYTVTFSCLPGPRSDPIVHLPVFPAAAVALPV